MARYFHLHIPHHRAEDEPRRHSGAAFLLILALAALAAVWIQFPPAASLLPTHPPG